MGKWSFFLKNQKIMNDFRRECPLWAGWAEGTWKYDLGSQVMRGHPWGSAKCAKWAKKPDVRKIGKNGQKIMKKNEKVPDFCSEISATTLHPTHHGQKKWKSDMGLPIGVRNCAKGHLTSFGHQMTCYDRRYKLIINLEQLFLNEYRCTRTHS